MLTDGAQGLGRPGLGTIAEVSSWVFLLPALAIFTPLWDARGVALALAVSAALSFAVLLVPARAEPCAAGAGSGAGAPRPGGRMIEALTDRWRWPLYALLVYLPVSGIAILAAYPGRTDRAIAILAKDFVFVIPAYALFAGYCLLHRKRPWFRGAPLVLIGLLALIVVIQAFNPTCPTTWSG